MALRHNLRNKLKGILEILHKRSGLHFGMITLRDVDDDTMSICEIYGEDIDRSIRYQPGEGLVGAILDEGSTIVVERIADEPRFLSRFGVYNPDLPFIGSPLAVEQGEVVGIIAAQPCDTSFLGERARFLEMVANLVAQSVNMLRVLERKQSQLTNERDFLKQALVKNYRFENIIGHSEPMLKVFDIIRQVSKWHTTVLIRGESGTGKEVVAFHSLQFRLRQRPFLKLNCAALPDNLLESELFGHEKGAFTGAVDQRKGRFELADNGTLFLDEIGDISPSFQANIAGVAGGRVGAGWRSQTLRVDVRIIAATNRNLEEDVANGTFREDFYYRLNVMPIYMPSLCDRLEDIPDLADFWLSASPSSKAAGRWNSRKAPCGY